MDSIVYYFSLQNILLILLIIAIAIIGVYAINWAFLTLLSFLNRKKNIEPPKIEDWPKVSINLPVYNEKKVIARLLNAVLNLDYPKDKLEIIVIDDSNDGTTQIIKGYEEKYKGLIKLIHRTNRDGFKAGALQLALENSTGEFIAIFDADYTPKPMFLKTLLPYLYMNENIAFVQARIGYLNKNQSWVTKAVALGLDGYCIVDQRARYASNLLAHFSGTNGVFRRKAIESVGSWSCDTLAEDLDLSVRLQLKGWKYVYIPQVACDGEIPPSLSIFRKQQFRWAKGFTECFKKHWRPILKSKSLSLFQKFEAILQLTVFFIYPISIVALALALINYFIFPQSFLNNLWNVYLSPLASTLSVAIYLSPLFMYTITILEVEKLKNKKMELNRLLHMVYLILVGIGIVFTNSLAVIEALIGIKSQFERTPKFGVIDEQLRNHS
jgi:cellulose synthase/poly-beta-1,6-N-acetylglucosamine synthase-like glycosyltransferase